MYGKQFCETSQISPSFCAWLKHFLCPSGQHWKVKGQGASGSLSSRAESGTLEVRGEEGLGGRAEDVAV